VVRLSMAVHLTHLRIAGFKSFADPVELAIGSVKNLGRYAASGIAWWPKRPSSTAALT